MGIKGSKGDLGGKGEKGEATQQANWKQCVWTSSDGKDSGLIQVDCDNTIILYECLHAFVILRRNVALRKSTDTLHCTWHMQETCAFIVAIVVLVGFSHLMIESAQDR